MFVFKAGPRLKIALYRVAVACASGSARLHFKLGCAWAELKEWPDAITAYEAALARNDTPAEWHFRLGIACEKSEHWGDASKAYGAALARDDSNATWHWRLGSVRARLEDWPAAAAAFESALARDDANAKWHLGLATAQARVKNWSGAVSAYEAAIARHPGNATWHSRLGSARAKLGDWSGASAAYEAAIARHPDDATWHSRLGSARAKLGDWSGAVTAYNAAIARDDANVELHRFRSKILSKAQDWTGASASYSVVLEADPEDELVRYMLAFSLSRCGNDKDALKFIQPCVDRNDLLLDGFLSRWCKNELTGSMPSAEILFVSGTNTIFARKVSLISSEKGGKTYFEHSRRGREKCQRIVDFYDGLNTASCQTFSRFVPTLHHYSLEDTFGYFLYDYIESAVAAVPGQVQKKVLADLQLGIRVVDSLIELARSGIAAKDPSADMGLHQSSALKDIRSYIESQKLLNKHDHGFVFGLDKLADDWCDHYSRYEALPRVLAHGNFHDQNMALSPDGKLSIFDWERFGYAPVGFDLVTLFRDSWDHDQFGHLANYYFDNMCADVSNDERSYILSMLMILRSVWQQKPLQKKWLRSLNVF